MKISIVFMLIYVIASSWCQDETVFHCSPKPGCQIAQCDSVAVGWDRPGFNIDKHLHDKEFPITCKSMNNTGSKNSGNLLPVVTRNILEIREHRSEIAEQSNKIKDFRNNALQQSRQIETLLKKNKEQNSVVNELKKELIEVQERNDKLEKELIEQNKTNNAMKKEMDRIEQKLTAMEELQQVQSGNQQISMTTNKTTLKPTPSPEYCKLKIGNICYSAVVRVENDVSYDKAVDICKKRNADVGLIREEVSYNAIIDFLRRNIPKGYTGMPIRTGIRFDPMTHDVAPEDSFIKWSQSFPRTGIEYTDLTDVSLVVHFNAKVQGMINVRRVSETHGVLCEIQI
uniref:uncharacterized protein LOC120346140 isoform X2 n=1 Tax=Styela clava TaxID=7725 RepID=UPI00193AA309|nr:uncharacterized protein LOC120346140 isoform X2 [Styela clava]